ncbi:MAG: hypothetical protein ACLFVJ_08545 [Persicimonas sp.]
MAACGGDDGGPGGIGAEDGDDNWASNNDSAADAGVGGGGGATDDADDFVPEEEEFLVREVATTASYVFVPNSAPESDTVARIDGRDLSIRPMPVGQRPTVVRAASVEPAGDVAYVLCEGSATVAIIRADQPADEPAEQVELLRVPGEVNSLALSPDGRHLLAYIDPDKPFDDDTSVASLQTAALIRLGDTPEEDQVFQLSVTRLIDEIEFTEDGDQAFIVGREGINRIQLDAVDADTFVPPLPLDLSGSVFPPDDLEVEVSPDGDFLVARSSEFAGVAIYQPPSDDDEAILRVVELSAIPTDIDLFFEDDGSPGVLATLRGSDELALLDVESVLDSGEDEVNAAEIISVTETKPGLAQLTPDGEQVLLYTSLVLTPNLGVLDLDERSVRAYSLRNQIRSVAVSTDSQTAVVVHRKQDGEMPSDADPLEFFQFNHGVTLFDIDTGYRRPVVLQGEPADLVMTENAEDHSLVYVMQQSSDPRFRGVTRINLDSYRTDFFKLARQPEQLGVVAGKVFVSQQSEVGRITFFDVDTGAQRTVSGYELNAGID